MQLKGRNIILESIYQMFIWLLHIFKILYVGKLLMPYYKDQVSLISINIYHLLFLSINYLSASTLFVIILAIYPTFINLYLSLFIHICLYLSTYVSIIAGIRRTVLSFRKARISDLNLQERMWGDNFLPEVPHQKLPFHIVIIKWDELSPPNSIVVQNVFIAWL